MKICNYCGYGGQDAEEHKTIHTLLKVVDGLDEGTFYRAWATIAVKCGWPFDGVVDAGAWLGWAKRQGREVVL